MADFDERSGNVPCTTAWGSWWQTMEEVFVEVNTGEEVKAKELTINISIKSLKVAVKDKVLILGDLYDRIQADESTWTLEDKKFIRICLCKVDRTSKNAWPSLLKDQYKADSVTYDQMMQKMTLQRFQFENPGMDFSGATISGQYQNGGPQLP